MIRASLLVAAALLASSPSAAVGSGVQRGKGGRSMTALERDNEVLQQYVAAQHQAAAAARGGSRSGSAPPSSDDFDGDAAGSPYETQPERGMLSPGLPRFAQARAQVRSRTQETQQMQAEQQLSRLMQRAPARRQMEAPAGAPPPQQAAQAAQAVEAPAAGAPPTQQNAPVAATAAPPVEQTADQARGLRNAVLDPTAESSRPCSGYGKKGLAGDCVCQKGYAGPSCALDMRGFGTCPSQMTFIVSVMVQGVPNRNASLSIEPRMGAC